MAAGATPPTRGTHAFRRDRITWASYLALGLFSYFLNIQGNIIPFLRDELRLSYRIVSLHPGALAAGLILCGLAGERVVARLGRRRALALGFAGLGGGAAFLVLAPTALISIAGCLLMGAPGGLVLVVVPAVLAERHGSNRAIALGEANAASYAASLIAALAMGLFTALGLNWRSGLLLGLALGGLIAVRHREVSIPEGVRRSTMSNGRLPAAYWAYWATLFGVIALEYCTLLWSPEFFEHVQGLSRPSAATAAAAFSTAMLTGRLGAAPLLRRVGAPSLFFSSLALTLPGFLLYWGVRQPVLSVAGLFVLGLGIALLYPLALGFAIGVAGKLGDAASARASLASGVAILSMPLALGVLADRLGLQRACLILPVLTAASGLCFIVARKLERSI